MIRNAVKWWGITRMKWSDDGLHLRIFFLGDAAKIRFRKISKFPYHKILVHSPNSKPMYKRTRMKMVGHVWTMHFALKRCEVSFLPEEAVREARNTFPDVALLRPWGNQFLAWELGGHVQLFSVIVCPLNCKWKLSYHYDAIRGFGCLRKSASVEIRWTVSALNRDRSGGNGESFCD